MATAAQDFNEKLRLERDLLAQLRTFNQSLVRQTVTSASTNQFFSALELQPELQELLNTHYSAVTGLFDHQISDDLSADIAETQPERARIIAALALFASTRATEQSAFITETNQQDMTDSFNLATVAAQEQVVGGAPVSPIDVAFITGAILNRKLNGRLTTIANTETQAVAEAAKLTEAEVLSGRFPTINGIAAETTPIAPEVPTPTSRWETRGDEKVRTVPFNHVAADGQVQTIGGVFTVGGQSLRFPGDTNLGASLGNIINCRCRLNYPTDEIVAVRRGAPTTLTISIEAGA